jgi:large subunit ribosomal protein L25
MEQIQVDANLREKTGKEAAKKLRQQGLVPVIVYNEGKDSIPLTIADVDLIHALRTAAGENVIINLNIKNNKKKEEKTVIIKDIQYHPIKGDVLHVDFGQISLTQNITVKVPVELKGEPIGVKRDQGALEHILWEIEVQCLPTNIPEKIEVKVDEMKIGDIVHVKDLQVEEGIEILNDGEDAIAVVEPPKKEEELPEEEEVEAAEVEEKEPEVISEKEREEREKEKAEAEQQQQQDQKQSGQQQQQRDQQQK